MAALAALAALAVGLVARNRSGSGRVPAAHRFDWQAAGLAPFTAAAGATAGATETGAPAVPPTDLARDEAIELVRRAFDALNAADVDTAAALMHPDVTWPRAPQSGSVHGRDEFRAHWSERLSNVSIYFEPIGFDFVGGELVVVTHEIVRRRYTDEWYGEYRAERRFSFRDGLIAAMSRGHPGGGSG